MFLVKDLSSSREDRIRSFLADDPAIAALLSIVHFEWTVRRAIISLGESPNVEIREKLGRCHGLPKYKELWQAEVIPSREKRLTEIVKNWDGLNRAFKLRHRLVHGIQSCGQDYAVERVHWAIAATTDIRAFCSEHSVDIDSRLPVRRRPTVK